MRRNQLKQEMPTGRGGTPLHFIMGVPAITETAAPLSALFVMHDAGFKRDLVENGEAGGRSWRNDSIGYSYDESEGS